MGNINLEYIAKGKNQMKITVKKSENLSGEILVGGSKNAALPIMAATILAEGESKLLGLPKLLDTENMKSIMCDLGVHTENDIFNTSNLYSYSPPYDMVKKLRGSILLAAPLLKRFGRCQIPLPGGCPIGTRPIDQHLKGLKALGAKCETYHGMVDIRCPKLKGNRIYLDFPSVGATENLVMAASVADGNTVIENAAAEPEVEDLCNFINQMGGKIEGAGGNTIKIKGVKTLEATEYKIIPDRIEAGTYLTAFAISHSKGEVKNICHSHQKPLVAKLKEMGIKIKETEDGYFVDATGNIKSASIKTLPYPGFPTDMQAQFASLLSVSKGTGMIVETVFENRFLHIGELLRMGAAIKVDGRTSVIEGVKKLTGAKVEARDLRGGAALVLAGLAADGETEISGAEHILRGYENFTDKLRGIGCDITLSQN